MKSTCTKMQKYSPFFKSLFAFPLFKSQSC